MTIREALKEGARLLETPCPTALIDTPGLDAALLLGEVLHLRREELIVRANSKVSEKEYEDYSHLLSRRMNGECIAYILGRKEFRGLEFTVGPQVLVPRPDSETLIEAALDYIENEDPFISCSHKYRCSLLDLCTGSGALAIALKHERPFLNISASDISPEALKLAQHNATRLLGGGHLGNLNFIESDLFENISGKFNIIISNPPYVDSLILPGLAPELHREPLIALDGGKGGLDLIRKIVTEAPDHLHPEGVLLLEADPGQMPCIRSLLEKNKFRNIRVRKDLAGRDRVVSARCFV